MKNKQKNIHPYFIHNVNEHNKYLSLDTKLLNLPFRTEYTRNHTPPPSIKMDLHLQTNVPIILVNNLLQFDKSYHTKIW